MKLRIGESEYDIERQNMALVTNMTHENRSDLLDGVYASIDDKNYLFIPEVDDSFPNAVDACLGIGMIWETFDGASERMGEAVDEFAFKAVAKCLVATCEDLCQEAVEDGQE